jgi:hypothetical protein
MVKKLLLLILFISTFQISFAQGCSDAGFCTISSLKPSENDSIHAKMNQLKVGSFFGSADNSILVYGGYLEYNRQLNGKFGADIKLSSLTQNGNDISVFGLSDLFVNVNYAPTPSLSLTLGTKIPLSGADRTLDGLPLPMDYQSSLGTFDLIFGIGYQIKKFHLVAAIQQPFTQNKNAFSHLLYPENSPLNAFQSTNQFERSGDVLLRFSYPIEVLKNVVLTPSLLPIYHLSEDRYFDGFAMREIEGSQGLTLNGNLYIDWSLDEKSSLQLNAGMPFLFREARPDGLTRSFIATLEYKIKF